MDYLHLNESKVVSVVDALHQLLADFQVHYANLRGLHWNIKGRGFFILHEKFENMYDDMAVKIDEVAERILMLGDSPDNRFSKYLEVAKLPEVANVSCGHSAVKYVLDTYSYIIKQEREILAKASEVGDDVTVDMITGYLKEQEKMVWMLVAFSSGHIEK